MVVNGALVHELYGTAYTFRHFWPMYHFFDHSNSYRLYYKSTGRYTAAEKSPRRLEAPKLHDPIAMRLKLLLHSMEN